MGQARVQAKARRSYRPSVEALEALRMLSSMSAGLPTVPVQHDWMAAAPVATDPTPGTSLTVGTTWDAALADSTLNEILGPSTTEADAESISAGLAQLNKYLGRAWSRAGISVQQQDDCTQAVYAALLQSLGRDRFDSLLSEIGQFGIPNILSRETADGPTFFRAIDTIKKRAQRERSFQSLDGIDAAASITANAAGTNHNGADQWRGALLEAMGQTLSTREAQLIHATLQGQTPSEIAAVWGVAPKTISNEKTRAIQKLRTALIADLAD